MIRKLEEQNVTPRPALFGGEGEVTMRHLLNGAEEMLGKGRLFARTTVRPGCSIGYHVHKGDAEVYYILRGAGLYNDNGAETTVGPGDVTYTAPGQGHSLACLGDEPLELIALVLYE